MLTLDADIQTIEGIDLVDKLSIKSNQFHGICLVKKITFHKLASYLVTHFVVYSIIFQQCLIHLVLIHPISSLFNTPEKKEIIKTDLKQLKEI